MIGGHTSVLESPAVRCSTLVRPQQCSVLIRCRKRPNQCHL